MSRCQEFFFFYFDLFRSVRWIIDLNGIVKTMKLLGENMGENLSDLESARGFLDRALKDYIIKEEQQ